MEVINMDGLFFPEIKDKYYNDLLEKTTSYIDELYIYGQYLFSLISIDEDSKLSDTVIIFLFREILETIDGIKSLFQGSSINISDILFRNLFELTLYLKYILSDTNSITKRALSYDVCNIQEKISMYEKLNIKCEGNVKFKKVLGNEILDNFNPEHLNELIDNLKNILEKYPEYKKVNDDRTAVKNKINKPNKPEIDPKWYQIYSKASSIRALSRLVDMEKYYLTLYCIWSKKTHGISAMDGFVVINNEPIIQNPKIPKRNYDVAAKLNLLQSFTYICYKLICAHFLKEEDSFNFRIWYRQMITKRDSLATSWRNVNFQPEE